MMLDTSEPIQAQMAAGNYEPQETGWVRRHIGSGSVFVDVGANFGWFTTLATSLVGRRGRVFAFEPSPWAFATLIKARGDRPNVELINAAVGRKRGWVNLQMPAGPGVHSPSVFKSADDFYPMPVDLVSLDTCTALADVRHIDMVKIDVEGSEADVLEGMREMIAEGRVGRVLCELNSGWLKHANVTTEQLAERFSELGFCVEAATEWQTGPDSDGGTFRMQNVLYRHPSARRNMAAIVRRYAGAALRQVT
jgi:FkbM family methyltransferase